MAGTPNNCEFDCNIKGAPRACTVAALMHANGQSVPRDGKRAFEFYTRGCLLGDAEACHLGGLQLYLGEGLKPSHSGAAGMFNAACKLSHADGCAMLGAVRAQMPGTQPLEVVEHLSRACRLGSGIGCVMLGRRHLTGDGVVKDAAEAKKMFHLGCMNGDPEGCELEKNSEL